MNDEKIVFAYDANYIVKEFAKYEPRFGYKDTLGYVKKFLEYREKYSQIQTTDNSYYMKHYYEMLYSNLKTEWTMDHISEADFWHLANICRDLEG